jgi:predicted NBD/HSP70 family sugar kinase
MPPDRNATTSGLGHAQIADHNSRTILEILRRNGPTTRIELATLTGLTAPGVTNVIRRHLAEGLITEGHRRTQNAQVPSAEYRLRPEGAYAIGVRVRTLTIEAILIDLSGSIHVREQDRRTGSDEAAIIALVDRMSKALAVPINLVGIGFAIDEDDQLDWGMLDQALGNVIVVGELDTLVAVLAERTLGTELPDTGMVMVLLEERIRSGLFLHSIPFAGVRGRAGRIGEMRTGRDRVPLNQVCSTKAFSAAVESARDEEGRSQAVGRWVNVAAEHLLDALMAIAGFVAPGKIMLAGDLPLEVLETLISTMRQNWEGQPAESPPPSLPPVAPASFPHDSVLLGAALLPFFEVLLPKPFGAEISSGRPRVAKTR